MSWDVCFLKFDRTYTSIGDIPDDARPVVLGVRKDIHAAVSAQFPGTDWSDPAWGSWEGDAGFIEFNLGDAEEVDSFTLHVRAADDVVPGIVELARQNAWQAMDGSSGDFLEQTENAAAGLSEWRKYRDKILAAVTK